MVTRSGVKGNTNTLWGSTMPIRDQSSGIFFWVGQRQMASTAEQHWDTGFHVCAEAHHSVPVSPPTVLQTQLSSTGILAAMAVLRRIIPSQYLSTASQRQTSAQFPGMETQQQAGTMPGLRNMKLTVIDMAQSVKALAAQGKWPKFNSWSPHKGGRREQTP